MRIPMLLLASVVCLAQPATPEPGQPQPRITFDSMHYDFGKIPGDANVTHLFKVTNTGKAPLNITRIDPSCGCTSTVVGKWTLAPGETTEVEVTFNPAGFRGLSRKSVMVTSDDPSNPRATLTFEADVVLEIMPSTDAVFFQDLVRTVPRKASVKLVSGTDKPVQLIDAKPKAGIRYLSATTRQDGNDAWVDITLNGQSIPQGRSTGADLILVRTRNAKVPTVPITVQWELRPSVVADPVRVAWKEPAGKELRSSLVLKEVSNKPFRILSAIATGTEFKLEGVNDTPAVEHTLQVIMSADAKPGLYTERIILKLDDPDQPDLEVRITADRRP